MDVCTYVVAITEQCVGSSATIGIEPSSINCMQVLPLIAINKLSDGRRQVFVFIYVLLACYLQKKCVFLRQMNTLNHTVMFFIVYIPD